MYIAFAFLPPIIQDRILLMFEQPPSVLGGMQVFLYSTIAVAGIRVLGLIAWTRRNRFILTSALGIGFIDIVQPTWFSQILDYSGGNVHLQGFEQGINLIVETPFIVAAVIGVFLNLVLPGEPEKGEIGLVLEGQRRE